MWILIRQKQATYLKNLKKRLNQEKTWSGLQIGNTARKLYLNEKIQLTLTMKNTN